MRDVLVYSVIRLALFGALWWVLANVGVGFYLAGIIAALIAMLVSILFLGRPRERAAERWQQADERRRERRKTKRDEDADEEDALVGEESAESGPAETASDRQADQQQD